MTPKKLQSFIIYRFLSGRLKDKNYDITITLDEARRNMEIVRLGNSAFLETIMKVEGKEFNPKELAELETKKHKKLSKSEKIKILNRIDEILFLGNSLIEIKFENASHYKTIVKNGLFINGNEFVRALAGAGNLRRNTVLFVKKSIYLQVMKILNNDRKQDVELNEIKLVAYFGLYNSSGHKVRFPRFCVVPDFEYSRLTKTDWINDDYSVEEKEISLDLNLFDGQGVISENMAIQWAEDLGLDYIPSTFIFRAPFCKGQLVVFPFHEFAKKIAKQDNITDVWGKKINIGQIDVIISKSQFKLWQSYENYFDYRDSCERNGLGFWITRYASKEIKKTSFLNYMFIQALNLSNDDIQKLCQPTIDYFKSLMGLSRKNMLLYLLPNTKKEPEEYSLNDFDSMQSALMLSDEIALEPHVVARYMSSLRKRIKESYLGNLLVRANFQGLIADPYLQLSYIFGLKPIGLLKEGEHYCKFWIDRGVEFVASARSPLTHQSEMNGSRLVSNEEILYWYRYVKNGFIVCPQGIDTLLYADADYDGDLIFTTDNPIIIKGRQGGNPISYDKKPSEKIIIKDMWDADVASQMSSKIGYITNLSSTYHCMLSNYDENSEEYKEIQRRLKIFRMLQGLQIDSAKGNNRVSVPQEWTKYQKKTDDMTQEEKDKIDFNNKLVANQRPRFMRHLYSHYNKQFVDELRRMDIMSREKNREPFVLGKDPELDRYYKRYSGFISNNSVMNRIEEYMLKSMGDAKKLALAESRKFDYNIFFRDNYTTPKERDLSYAEELNNRYWAFRKSIYGKNHELGDNLTESIHEFSKQLRKTILFELRDEEEVFESLVVYLYVHKRTKRTDILWDCFSDIILERLKERTSYFIIPKIDKNGDIEYLYEKYSFQRVNLPHEKDEDTKRVGEGEGSISEQ